MKGIYNAMVTAFSPDGEIDEAGTRAVVRHSLDHLGVDGLFVGGTMGERYKMSGSSLKKVYRIAREEAGKSVPMMANISSLAVEEVLELAAEAKLLGYDAAGVIPPFFHGYSSREINDYYKYVADHVQIPVLIYVIPPFSGVEFSVEQLTDLLHYPNIIGIKYTHHDYYVLDRIRVACPDASLFTGLDDILLQALLMGTDGAVGGTYNLTGRFAVRAYKAVRDGNYEKALEYQRQINDVEDLLNETGLFVTLKAALREMGIPCGELRFPSEPAGERQKAQAVKICRYLKEHDG